MKNITEETESSTDGQTTTETTTKSDVVVTQSDQHDNDNVENVENEPEITTNRPEEEEDSFTEDFEDLVYNDLENEVSNNPFEGDIERLKSRKSEGQYCREAEGGTFPRW